MALSRHELITARLAKVRRNLDQIVDRLTPDIMDWAPAEGMRTVSGQLAEILFIEIPLIGHLKDGEDMSDAAVDEIIGDSGSLDNLRRQLIAVRERTLSYLNSLSDIELSEEVGYGGPWFGSLWLPTLPRAEVFLNVAEHEFYHVGQLTSYLWARGDNPYNW